MLRVRASLILFITSDPSTRETLEALLNGVGFTLEFSETGQNGVEKATQLLPEAIVVDTRLKTPPSNETIHALRNIPGLVGLPILALVEQNDHAAQSAAFLAGANDFITLPLNGLELLARLQSITRLQVYSETLADLKRFAWMVEHAAEGYLLLDRQTNIQYANLRAVNMLNLPEEHAGLNFIEIVESQYIPRPPEAWRTWQTEPVECFLMSPENAHAHAVWIVLEALDTPMGIEQHRVVRLRDVTEKMSIYHDIRKFHNAVTHKLRTPVSVMASSLSLINSHIDKIPPEEIKDMMLKVGKNAARLVAQVRDVLTYIDAPLAANIGAPMALSEMETIIQQIREQLGLKYLTFNLPPALAEQKLGLTSMAMELILEELLENSKKFHPAREPHIQIGLGQTDPRSIRLRVADDGMTLSAEQLAWAWLPYFQGEKDFTGELPGMGLGFPLVATLVWQAGGNLRLSNRADGPGVMVEMSLPIAVE